MYSYNEYSKQLGENFLDEYFSIRVLENTELTSVFSSVGYDYVEVSLIDDAPNQRVEVYTGDIFERDGGFVVVRDSENRVICCEESSCISAGFNSIYLGKTELGEDFLMTVSKDDREFYGEYRYSVFRIGQNGEKKEIAGSVYEWDHGYEEHSIENCEECQTWQKEVDEYLNNSILLLSTQDFRFQVVGE